MAEKTDQQYEHVIKLCRDVFEKKMKDYGTAWRILRPSSMTDQILIKARRIRSIETKGTSKIKDDIRSEFIGIVNYATMALIQLELGPCEHPSMNSEEALELYNKHIYKAKNLMADKNHDYDEAWRNMRISSFTDLILMKIYRTKQIENNQGKTLVSEGIDANYMDIINYAVFGLIKLEFPEDENV
ncbi:MAG: hypothetical protein PWQ17_2490 [Anaerophaga sp.]|uniref:DUF1599 domain-containing protein n=1 Tax=Anaerophaga thermohalophila TaxID=177400 RepID=UPI0002D7B047|nr:DUF1599 domain-containing protein [Anaerophaga thermohalophila]MDI3521468.1 hypothetical protein [Anaerophaga sp.]MDK2842984.1 hypothetical protein [Anaerophaga sp.]MDN5292393.1 hypothetical protein [Anaerophaga sp.]